jgi:putative ABC transport system permease protein
MGKNYFKTAIRFLVKRKAFTLLNIGGLITGMTCALFIFHYVSYEKSYDTFQPLSKQVARLRLDIFQNGKRELQSVAVYPAIAPAMKKDFPDVEDFCRLHTANLLLSSTANNAKHKETKGFYADPSFVKIFAVDILAGNPALLKEPFQVMLSENMAQKYFGNGEAVGKTLVAESGSFRHTYLVTAVFKEYPANAHLTFDYLLSYSTYGSMLQQYGYPAGFTEESWEFRDIYAYLQFRKGSDLIKIQAQLPAFCERYINNRPEKVKNKTRDELHLTSLRDIHLNSNYFYEAGTNGNGQTVSFLFLIALFIISVAWINYINLATARAAERAREVGVRKVMGATRTDLIRQFLSESFLLNTIALIVSVVIFFVFVHRFDEVTGKTVSVRPLLSAAYVQLYVALFLGGAFVSGIYPAFVLSAFNPVIVLKGFLKKSTQGLLLRKGLIVLQFIISIALIAGTAIVYQQLEYMRSRRLGADISQTLVLNGATSASDTLYQQSYEALKMELLRSPNIKSVAASTSVMGKEIAWTRNAKRIDIPGGQAVPLFHMGIDYDFIPQYDIKFVAGRNFSRQFTTDTKAALLNETSAHLLGFSNPIEAINKKMIRSSDTVTIVGVVADFHQEGLQQKIEPLIFLLMPGTRNYYSVKMQSSDTREAVNTAAMAWRKYFPGEPFSYFFLEKEFNEQYKSDMLFGKVFAAFSILAILISCFGLLGLSAYSVLQRAKEISIRKILGAGAARLVIMLISDFARLLGIAFIISVPIAWLTMNSWLQNFAYRINISWWVFAIAGIATALIALLTVLSQVARASIENPIKKLGST